MPTSGSRDQSKQKLEQPPLRQHDGIQAPVLSLALGRAGGTARSCPAAGVSAPPPPSGAVLTPLRWRPSLTTPHCPLSCPLSLLYVSARHVFPPPGLTLTDHLAQNASSMKAETCSQLGVRSSCDGAWHRSCPVPICWKEGREGGRRGEGRRAGAVTLQPWQIREGLPGGGGRGPGLRAGVRFPWAEKRGQAVRRRERRLQSQGDWKEP